MAIARHWEPESHDNTQKEVATDRAQVEQQANDVFGELSARLTQENRSIVFLRGSLTEVQREAQAEANVAHTATQKTGFVESAAK